MSDNSISSVACTGCRIRRKKCDRAKPICSGCQSLNVPIELCLYPEQKASYRGKNAKNTLEELQKKNKLLYKEQLHYKNKFEDVATKSIKRSDLAKIPVPNKQQPDFLRRDFFSHEKWGHCGLLSWASLLIGEPSAGMVNLKFNEIVNKERAKYSKAKTQLTNETLTDTKLAKIRRQVTEMNLGIEPFRIDVLYDLLDDIVGYLPNYNMARMLFSKYFQLNKSRGLQIDEEEAIADFHRLLSAEEDGSLVMKMVSPKKIVDYFGKLSMILVIITYPIIYQHFKLPQKESKNYLLLFAYADLMVFTSLTFHKHSSNVMCTLPTLQALSQIRHFEHYFPYGKNDGEDGASVSLSLKAQISLFKSMRLDQNIDVHFANKSEAHKNSLKSLYYYYVFHDIYESFELGLPAKFKSDDIINYENFGDSKLRNSINTLSRVLERFHRFESLLNVQNPCDMIENDFIYELHALLHIEFEPFSKAINDFQNLDLETTTAQDLMQICHNFSMMIFITTVILSLYGLCLRKVQQFEPEAENKIKRFKILSIKYSFLVLFSQVEILKGFQRILTSSQVEIIQPLEPLIRLSCFFRMSLRRLSIFIGARIYDFAPYDNSTIIKLIGSNSESFNAPRIDERTILGMTPEFFEIEDLEDWEIDRNNGKLLEKFSTKMLDYKVLLLQTFRAMTDMKYSIINDKYNIKFIKNNFTYYQVIKLLSFMINVVYSEDCENNESLLIYQGIKKEENENSPSDQFYIDDALFQQLLDTNFQKFDYNTFFSDPLELNSGSTLTTPTNHSTANNYNLEFDNFFDTFASKVNNDSTTSRSNTLDSNNASGDNNSVHLNGISLPTQLFD